MKANLFPSNQQLDSFLFLSISFHRHIQIGDNFLQFPTNNYQINSLHTIESG